MVNEVRKNLGILAGTLLVVGSVVLAAQTRRANTPATGDSATRDKILRYVRERFNIPETVKLTISPFRNSAFPEFYETTITIDDGKQKHSQNFFVSKNGRYLIEGSIFTLGADPKREVARTISTQSQPSTGPPNAPVTIVEYADLQCPQCSRMHEFLEKELLAKYGAKVRVIYKEFPLVNVHDWALTGAIASQCAYQINPATFQAYRSLIFQHQGSINASNSRNLLIEYGEQAGIDRLRLAACIDAKQSLPRVEENAREGQALGVTSTPTSFINGKVVVGTPPPNDFYKAIDDALRAAR